jgi:hypothetical protein
MELRAGTRLKSAVDSTEIIVVKPSTNGNELRCGGVAMVPLGEAAPEGLTIADHARGGTQLGKRYVSAEAGLEVLCTKGGEGTLALGDTPLELQGAKPLPPSD